MLRDNKHVRRAYRGGARHLLVDEYQDINEGQRELIRLLSEGLEAGLVAAGDDDQSIYRFRGGSPVYVREFDDHFGPAGTVRYLTNCHRCPPPVLAGALAMVARFKPGRLDKSAPQPTPECAKIENKIHMWSVPSDEAEAKHVAKITYKSLPSRGVLILFPRWSFAEDVRAALRRRRIPHSGRPSPFDTGLWQLGSTLSSLADRADNIKFRELLQALLDGGGLIPGPKVRSKGSLEQREPGIGVVAALWHPVLNQGMTVSQALHDADNAAQPLAELRTRVNELSSAQHKGPAEFLEAFGRHVRPWPNLDSMGDEVRLWLDQARARAGSGVRLMTMHSAKGIEDDVVIILGMEEGVFPREGAEPDEIAEDSRLLYVSMTRAKRELHIFHARKRSAGKTFLKDSWQLNKSRFLDAMPKEHVKLQFIPAKRAYRKSEPRSNPFSP